MDESGVPESPVAVADKRRTFAAVYVASGFDHAKAAVAAGYDHRYARKLLSHPVVREEIDKHIAGVIAREAFSANMVLGRLAAIAYSSLDQVATYDADGNFTIHPFDKDNPAHPAMKKVTAKRVRDRDGDLTETVSLELESKLTALGLLGKHGSDLIELMKATGEYVPPPPDASDKPMTPIDLSANDDYEVAKLLAETGIVKFEKPAIDA